MVLTRLRWSITEGDRHPLQTMYDENLKKLSATIATIDDGVVVNKSHIQNAGNGLFATRVYHRGDIITAFSGCLMEREEAIHLDDVTYVRSLIHGRLVVDGIRHQVTGLGGASFANDDRGARNNSAFRALETAGLPTLVLVALRAIDVNDEILTSYGTFYWKRSALRTDSG